MSRILRAKKKMFCRRISGATLSMAICFILSIFPDGAGASEIRGHLALEGEESPEGTQVQLFDGFSLTPLPVGGDGTFIFRTDRVPEEAGRVLFASRKGYLPESRFIKGGEVPGEISIRLRKMAGPDQGLILGILYTPMSGGKRAPRMGIYQTVSDREVIVSGDAGHREIRTDPEGRFLLAVSPGRYRLKADGNPREYPVNVSAGETAIQNIPIGRALVD